MQNSKFQKQAVKLNNTTGNKYRNLSVGNLNDAQRTKGRRTEKDCGEERDLNIQEVVE